MAKGGQHVVPGPRGWSVKRTGSVRASSTHSTQEEAIAAAVKIAKNQKTVLYIHDRDGRIRERSSYMGDIHPAVG